MSPIVRQKRTGGRKPDPLRVYLQTAYGLSRKQVRLAVTFTEQLAACADDSARRLLLGVSEKFELRRAA